MKTKLYDVIFGTLLLAIVLIAVFTIAVGLWWLFKAACAFIGISKWAMVLVILVLLTVTMTLTSKKDGD